MVEGLRSGRKVRNNGPIKTLLPDVQSKRPLQIWDARDMWNYRSPALTAIISQCYADFLYSAHGVKYSIKVPWKLQSDGIFCPGGREGFQDESNKYDSGKGPPTKFPDKLA